MGISCEWRQINIIKKINLYKYIKLQFKFKTLRLSSQVSTLLLKPVVHTIILDLPC